MKGTPVAPRCGFSKRVVQILDSLGVKYGSRDVLQDDTIREGVKKFSEWPTIPQLFVNGEFIGGCDIINDMFKNGQLHDTLEKATGKEYAKK